MKVRIAFLGICAASLGLAAVAMWPSQHAFAGDTKGGMMSSDKKDIIDTAVGPGMQEVTTVVTAIKAAGLVDTLKGPGPFTVLRRPTRRSRSCPRARSKICSSRKIRTNSSRS